MPALPAPERDMGNLGLIGIGRLMHGWKASSSSFRATLERA